MPTKSRDNAVVVRLSRYLHGLFSRVGDPVVEHLGERVWERVEATLDVITDPAALDDLRLAAEESDDAGRPYEEIRRDVGLA